MRSLTSSIVGGGGSLSGAPASGYSPAFGGIPQIPSPGSTASAALGSNIGNLGQIYRLGSGINAFNTEQALSQIGKGLPDYQSMVAQSSKNIGSNLRGELPSDVITQILQNAAERGIITGTSGAPNSNAAYLRALGLTSLNLQQQGEQELTQAIARTPRPTLFDPNLFLISPAAAQEAQTAANYMSAAPIPAFAAGAALGAAKSGIGAGRASIVSPPTNPFAPQTYSSNPFAPEYNPGVIVGGATGTPEASPEEVAARWQQWASGLPQPKTAGAGVTDAEGIPLDYVPGQFGNFFEDLG